MIVVGSVDRHHHTLPRASHQLTAYPRVIGSYFGLSRIALIKDSYLVYRYFVIILIEDLDSKIIVL